MFAKIETLFLKLEDQKLQTMQLQNMRFINQGGEKFDKETSGQARVSLYDFSSPIFQIKRFHKLYITCFLLEQFAQIKKILRHAMWQN